MKIIYDGNLTCDGSQGGLRILYPEKDGFVEYTFVHSVVPEKNCDLWRMSVVNALDANGAFLHPLTKAHAEWEMAIRLENRPDFIGGYNHGDEIGRSPVFVLDGETVDPETLFRFREFSRLEISVDSTGYDPADPSEVLLKHHKKYCFNATGVHLEQEVLWLQDVTLDGRLRSYLAMMPPLKHDPKEPERAITDSFAFGNAPFQSIGKLPVESRETCSIQVKGEQSRFRFRMTAEGYEPCYPNGYFALLTDNGSHMNYHKMYIAFVGGDEENIPAGTKWRGVTHYSIDKN